jgi:C-terminal processing protease CtpA/Prc
MLRLGGIVVVVLFLACVLFVAADMYRGHLSGPMQDGIERDLGFRIGTPYVGGHEVVTIENVVRGKPMARAGMQSHDILIAPHYRDTRDLFDDLDRARGGTFAMTVERDGKRVEAVVAVPRRPTGAVTQPVRGGSTP